MALFVANLVAWNYVALMTHLGGVCFTSCRANAALVCLALLLPMVVATASRIRSTVASTIPLAKFPAIAISTWVVVQTACGLLLFVLFDSLLLCALTAGNRLAHTTGSRAWSFAPWLVHGALVVALWRVRRRSETFGRWLVLACGWIAPTLLLPWALLGFVVGVDHDLQSGEWYTRRVPTTASSYCTLRQVASERYGRKSLRLLAVTEFLPGIEWWRWAATEPPLPPNAGELDYDGGDLVERHPDGVPIRCRLR